ncbi:MAG: sigma-70 family RNA polymerase sigma factor, partial [Actinomycetota bacterium]|nr:sigma-70 family RNA polymerase sigma factor [Actinomycetota bacterium]
MEAHALRARAHGGRGTPGALRRIASDERLVASVRAGDDRAFEALFERYQRPILSFCRHMLGSREEAEDAAQQAFLSAYNGIRAGDRELQLRPWLYTIARNHCLSQLRARREQSSLEDAEPSVEGLASEVQRRADLREVLRDLARLPEDQRAALVLSELGDLSHDEIAGVLDCPKGKVKALVFQARSSLAASRQARDTSCAEIREQLATLSGGALRRT